MHLCIFDAFCNEIFLVFNRILYSCVVASFSLFSTSRDLVYQTNLELKIKNICLSLDFQIKMLFIICGKKWNVSYDM